MKSQIDGVILSVHFREGEEVKPGDLLVTLDRRPFENALRIARANLGNAGAESRRPRGLVPEFQARLLPLNETPSSVATARRIPPP